MNEDDELTRRRGKPPKQAPPGLTDKPKRSRRADDAARSQQTKSALYHLTPQELKFVQALATGMNQTEACKAAGWRADGERAKVRAWRLMKKPVVRAALYELMVQSFDKASIEVTQWLREVASIAFLPPDLLEGKARWSDKTGALKLIGEFQKLLEKTAPTTREVNIVNLITQTAAPKTAPVESAVIEHARNPAE